MSWWKNIIKLFGKKRVSSYVDTVLIDDVTNEITVREAAFHACVNLIANTVSNCDLRVYKDYQSIKDAEWYRWNVQPNPQYSAAAFWQKFIHRLYEDNEALIITRPNGDLYVADSFIRNIPEQVFRSPTYEGIIIDDLPYEPILREDQVFYFKLHDSDIKLLSDQTVALYGELITAFLKSYKSGKGTKGVLYIDQIAESADDFQETFDNLTSKQFKSFLENDNAVIPLFDGFKYEQISNSNGPSFDTRDLHNQIQDIFEIYAMAFGIPKHLITGDVQDTSKAIEYLLTFALDPLLKLIETELKRKLFSKRESLDGCYVQWKTNTIKHIDILDVAGNVEKLISSGSMTINEVRSACGYDPLESEFADNHFMTKNFAPVSELVEIIDEGGEST